MSRFLIQEQNMIQKIMKVPRQLYLRQASLQELFIRLKESLIFSLNPLMNMDFSSILNFSKKLHVRKNWI